MYEEVEMVDIVNTGNEILYSIPKKEAHEKGLLHRCVIANIIDDEGRFVLVRQASDRQDAGQYVSPVGGHARTGETEDDALRREAFEETGLKDFKYKLMGRFVYNRFVLERQENHYFVVYEIYNNHDLQIGEEAVSYKTFTKDEIKQGLSANRKDFGDAFVAVVENTYPELLR